jgi:hypothetical protein
VEASDISIDEAVDSEMLRCGLLLKAHTNEDAGRNLQNLHTCQPVLCPDDEGIVYLITRSKFLHPKAWVLAVNMRKKRVQAMASIETERSLDSSLAFFPSRISSYISAAVPGIHIIVSNSLFFYSLHCATSKIKNGNRHALHLFLSCKLPCIYCYGGNEVLDSGY